MGPILVPPEARRAPGKRQERRPGSGAGPGAPGGGAPGGWGDGGFLTSVLGGLFSAPAGSWLYDSMFRHGGWGGSEAHGSEGEHGSGGGEETGAGDFGGDF